jgi:hypothetical protein
MHEALDLIPRTEKEKEITKSIKKSNQKEDTSLKILRNYKDMNSNFMGKSSSNTTFL